MEHGKISQRAADLYQRAINEDGSFDAAANLAFMLECGNEIPKDSARAFQLLYDGIHEDGFEGYNAEEAFRLAGRKDGIKQDSKRALDLLHRVTVKGGNVHALSSLGSMVEKGIDGIPANAPQAVQLYEMALAQGGEMEALHNLAAILMGVATG